MPNSTIPSHDIDVCICTHNPRLDILKLTLAAVAKQTLKPSQYRLIVIDNASSPPIEESLLAPLVARGISCRIVREPTLGNAYARAKAFRECTAPLVAFVDDDTVLAEDYLAVGLEIMKANPNVGCLGGKLLRAPYLRVPKWLEPLRSYLAICDDKGERQIVDFIRTGGLAEPPSAGMIMRRHLSAPYLEMEQHYHLLGRKGRHGLRSMEDNLITRSIADLGFACAYDPHLMLVHHIDPSRFHFGYVVRLLYGQGRSEAVLARILGYGKTKARDRLHTFLMYAAYAIVKQSMDPRTIICVMARNLGTMRENLLSK
jgi:glycosyltransferase involved in cell wall biosynthesis